MSNRRFSISAHAIEQKLGEGSGASAVGTVGYMPPEQAFGIDSIDHRTDIWAFCAIVYESLSGRTPVIGETLEEQRRALVEETIPSLAATIGVDDALWLILERGLRKEPSERWPGMRELGQELARWLLSRGVYDDVCGSSIVAEWLRPRAPADERFTPAAVPSADTFGRPSPMPFPLIRAKAKVRVQARDR